MDNKKIKKLLESVKSLDITDALFYNYFKYLTYDFDEDDLYNNYFFYHYLNMKTIIEDGRYFDIAKQLFPQSYQSLFTDSINYEEKTCSVNLWHVINRINCIKTQKLDSLIKNKDLNNIYARLEFKHYLNNKIMSRKKVFKIYHNEFKFDYSYEEIKDLINQIPELKTYYEELQTEMIKWMDTTSVRIKYIRFIHEQYDTLSYLVALKMLKKHPEEASLVLKYIHSPRIKFYLKAWIIIWSENLNYKQIKKAEMKQKKKEKLEALEKANIKILP